MNRLAEAFERIKDRKASAIGKREWILLNGRKVEALVSEITADEAFVSGGTAQAGGFHCQIAATDRNGKTIPQPRKFTPIEVRGNKLQVLSANEINGVTYDLTAGDPTVQ